MRRIVTIVLLLLLTAVSVDAQRTTRQRLKARPVATSTVEPIYDTIARCDDKLLVFSGYEKVLRSTKESFFVTNNTRREVVRLVFEIDYKDMSGNMLDRRRESVDIEIPSGSTRKIDIPAWDKQKVFYYYRSPQPKTAQATPYKVKIRLVAALSNKFEE